MSEMGFEKMKQAIFKFQKLDDSEWEAFSKKLKILELKKGQYLIREGQVEHTLFFLHTGVARSYFINDGKELTFDFVFEGEFVTAYYSFLTRTPSQFYIELLEDATAVTISHKSLHELYDRYHNIERFGRLAAEYQFTKRVKKEIEMISLSGEERYDLLVKNRPDVIQNIAGKDIASYLGIRPESLSRIRKLYIKN